METTETNQKVFLLFEWTEEREAKNHIGVFTTLKKAQQAAQRSWEEDQRADGEEAGELEWKDLAAHGSPDIYWGEKPENEYMDESPFEINTFELDVFFEGHFVPGKGYELEKRYV